MILCYVQSDIGLYYSINLIEMKSVANQKINKLSLIFSLAVLGLFSIQSTSAQYDDGYYDNNNGYYDDRYDNGDYQQFYDDLSPHGTWMQDPTYGYVWSPRVGRDFRPYYTNGNWAMTDMGNMWVSSYSWGGIPFHYGRWVFNDFYGWLWVPGRTWAPAWVVWRQSNAYYGWAPMGPSVSINFNFGNYYNSYYDYWNFIPCGNIYTGNYGRYRMRNVNYNFFNQTTVINNYHSHNSNRFFAGPRAADVRRVTGRDVRTYRVNQVNTRSRTSIRGNDVNVYARDIGTSRSGVVAAPRKVSKIESGRKTRVDQTVGSNYRSNVRTSNPTREQGIRENKSTREVKPNRQISTDRNTKSNREIKSNRQIQSNREVKSVQSDRSNNIKKNEVRSNTNRQINRNQNKSTQPKNQEPRTINQERKQEPKVNRSQQPTSNRTINNSTPRQNNNVNRQSAPKREIRSSSPTRSRSSNIQSAPRSNKTQMSSPRSSSPSRSMNRSRR